MSFRRCLRSARAWSVAAALALPLGLGFGVPQRSAQAAVGSTSKQKTGKQKTSKQKTSKKRRKKKRRTKAGLNSNSKPVEPQLRIASAPASVSDLWLGLAFAQMDEQGTGQGTEQGVEDDLDALAAQYEVEIATGQVALDPVLKAEVAAPAEPEPAPVDDKPKWIRHRIIPAESLDSIAERYGVSKKSLLKWNKMDPRKVYLRAGKTLKVRALRPPPPRERIEYEIQKRDTWEKIAKAHDVDVKLLRKWNKPRKSKNKNKNKNGKKKKAVLIAGKTLKIWVEPELAGHSDDGAGAGVLPGASGSPAIDAETRRLLAKVRRNAFSIGKPTKGRVANGVTLPDGTDFYTLRKPAQAFGSSHTVKTAIRAIGAFRQTSGYRRALVIGALSLPRGGRFRPHRSHQSGRDIDIRLPVRKSVEHHKPPRAKEVDWRAAWLLIKAFVDTGQIRYIFLEHRLQKILYKAAKANGASKKDLAEIIQWPRPSRSNNGIVRHSPGHTAHIHVRVKCGPKETRCTPTR